MLKLKYGDKRDSNQAVIGADIKMIEGTCPRCNKRCYGWALLRPGDRHCEKCGERLLITEDGRRVIAP